MRRTGIYFICTLMLTLSLSGCGNGKKAGAEKDAMSEMEQLKYDNALKKLEAIYAEAGEVATMGAESGMSHVREKIRTLKYDFNAESMGEDAQEKCRALKERIDALKQNPDAVFQDTDNAPTETATDAQQCRSTLVSRRNMELATLQRFPYYFNEGDKVTVTMDCQGKMNAAFYNINRQTRVKQWTIDRPTTDSIAINTAGIYMLELKPVGSEVVAEVSLAYTGTDRSYRPRVREKLVSCRAGDFLAESTDSIVINPVFGEPVKLGLRGNLKAAFSGKSRSVVSVPVPAGCDALLYSLRISTNENTISSDGKFPEQLSVKSKKIKLFGMNVYESQRRGIIDRLLGDTRPPREDDAFCNLYVFTSKAEAKKFQDGTESSGNYKYDVDQSKMGTQSFNGRLQSTSGKTLYLGFENARMRYDNYIWLEVAALKHVTKRVRPIYTAKK